MSNATAQEQLLLEMINRARLDPQGEATRYGIGLNQGLAKGTLNGKAKQPLSMNDLLIKAADGHSKWMLDNDLFRHSPGKNGSDPGDRMTSAGYKFTGQSTWGENISWNGSSGKVNKTAAIFTHHEGLFKSPGHRTNMLNEDFREAGLGQQTGQFTSNGTVWNASMMTEKFAKTGAESDVFITGVFYNDRDRDDFYDVGEGVKNGKVTSSGSSDRSGKAGGYEVAVTAGTNKKVTLKSGSKKAVVEVDASENVKLDFLNKKELHSSTDTKLINGVKTAELLGVDNLDLTGGKASETLIGNSGKNTIKGGGGKDRIEGEGGRDQLFGDGGNDRLFGDRGNDKLNGGAGNDHLNGGSGRDIIRGGGGRDKIDGGGGNDVLFGNAGKDTFAFKSQKGKNTIKDFTPNVDKVDLRKMKGIDNFSDVKLVGKGADTLIDLGKTDIVLEDVSKSQLDAGDFLI